ncbi:MAG: endolytic transglycosylase MltG [Chthonomonadales bacterium]
MKRKKGKSRAGIIVAGVAAVVAIGAIGFYNWFAGSLQPLSEDQAKKTVTIPIGSGPVKIGNILESAGIIKNSFAFSLYARFRGNASSFRSGTYKLSPSMSVAQIALALRRGGSSDSRQASITFPEGWNIKQIADRMVGKKVATKATDVVAMVGPKSTTNFDVPFDRPKTGWEGYLFPDTYSLIRSETPQALLQRMLTNFTERFYNAHKTEVEASGHTLHEIVTIASLIEMEAEVDVDRAKIAGVIENRLNKKMKLDIDATVIYALGHHKTRVLYSDLKVNSPYNTYRHKGLPPAPIASPGLPSLIAALHPEQSEYLFYVAGPNRTHIFTKSEAEHNAVVAKLRAEKKNAATGTQEKNNGN